MVIYNSYVTYRAELLCLAKLFFLAKPLSTFPPSSIKKQLALNIFQPMDTQDIRTLKLLEEIDKDYTQSQRDLSSKLDISLGLVNSFVKRLANKGYFKITALPKNRVKYILTPKGAMEKTRLTYQYLQYSFELYRGARRNLQKHFNELVAQGVKRVVFYGVSEIAEIAYISLQETAIKMVAIVDEKRVGKIFLGNVVKDPNLLGSLSFDRILITW
ncbi:MAG: winged helix-turn-helix transcriptional regulator [Ignavibacteriaceae bacterium]